MRSKLNMIIGYACGFICPDRTIVKAISIITVADSNDYVLTVDKNTIAEGGDGATFTIHIPSTSTVNE